MKTIHAAGQGAGMLYAALRFLYMLILLLIAASWGCDGKTPVEDANGVAVSELPGATYAVAIMDEKGSLVLLGLLRFDAISGETITGASLFESWGEQPEFPGYPVNTGEQFPDGVPETSFDGHVFGDMVILSIPLPESDRTLGIVIDEQDGIRLFGSVDTLPDKTFSGRIDAIRDLYAR